MNLMRWLNLLRVLSQMSQAALSGGKSLGEGGLLLGGGGELLLGGESTPPAGGQVSQRQDAGSSRSGLNANAPPYPPQPTTSLYVTTNKTVLLQTARTRICNPNQPAKSKPFLTWEASDSSVTTV